MATRSSPAGEGSFTTLRLFKNPRADRRLSVNRERLLERLYALGAVGIDEEGRRTRLAATDADKEARDLVAGWMAEAGLAVETDAVGNLFGIWETEENRGREPVMMGSHIDTVVDAGQYDGCLGVLAGIEVAAALREAGCQPARPLAVAVFTNEEGVRYAPDMMGSRVYAGELAAEEALAAVGTDGTVLGEELRRIGWAGKTPLSFPKPCAYVELHAEQGPLLDTEGIPIGAVEDLQGISWCQVTVEGTANHAGTTPIGMRADAGLAAAKAVAYLRTLCLEMGGETVATVGSMAFSPGAINVIPSKAVFTVDMRNPREEGLREGEEAFARFLMELERTDGVRVSQERLARSEPVRFDEGIVRLVEEAALGRGLACRRITSGAGQDAQMLARLCPSAMVFVPSVQGISHNPQEFTRPEDVEAGANVLLDVAAKLSGANPYTGAAAEEAGRFHRSLPGYRPTPLVSLPCLASKLGVRGIYVKDESARFGLKAFKGLGGAYAMYRILCEKLGLDPRKEDFASFQREEIREKAASFTFVTATDGNHGKGVSWAAGLFGCKAFVFMPAGSSKERAAAIRSAGPAQVEITGENYDGTVGYARRMSEENGWILIQDTAWDGYEAIPLWIIQGYLTMAGEAVQQLAKEGVCPTHVFLQAGVGAMAGGICGFLLEHYRDCPPEVILVEPEDAACVFASAQAGDGRAHTVEGSPQTIMAGLNCGTPCKITWPVLRDCGAAYLACPDSTAVLGMRTYARPAGTDPALVSGESGAATMGAVRELLEDPSLSEARESLGLGRDSVILLFSTEGDTDAASYQAIVG